MIDEGARGITSDWAKCLTSWWRRGRSNVEMLVEIDTWCQFSLKGEKPRGSGDEENHLVKERSCIICLVFWAQWKIMKVVDGSTLEFSWMKASLQFCY